MWCVAWGMCLSKSLLRILRFTSLEIMRSRSYIKIKIFWFIHLDIFKYPWARSWMNMKIGYDIFSFNIIKLTFTRMSMLCRTYWIRNNFSLKNLFENFILKSFLIFWIRKILWINFLTKFIRSSSWYILLIRPRLNSVYQSLFYLNWIKEFYWEILSELI